MCVYACMYVCMCVCMLVGLHVLCMYVCMYAYTLIQRSTNGSSCSSSSTADTIVEIRQPRDSVQNRENCVCVCVCVCVYMHVCMYV